VIWELQRGILAFSKSIRLVEHRPGALDPNSSLARSNAASSFWKPSPILSSAQSSICSI
jgi:hypothetical protein